MTTTLFPMHEGAKRRDVDWRQVFLEAGIPDLSRETPQALVLRHKAGPGDLLRHRKMRAALESMGYTVTMRGPMSALYGARFDEVIDDLDFLPPELFSREDERVQAWFDRVVKCRLGESGRMTMIPTHMGTVRAPA